MFVEDNMHVKINSDDDTLVLYMTTSAGVGVYSIEKQLAFFSSWDNINNLNFMVGKRRSLKDFFSNDRD